MSALATHGAWYAAAGWALVPLRPATKRPYITTGADHAEAATCDRDVIAGWVEAFPDADIGIVPARSGHIVIDVDDPEAFDAHRDAGFEYPLTAASLSGREGGGWHLWYRVPPGVDVPRGRVLAPGLELKAAGNLVVAPPSRHKSGRLYTWDVHPDLVAPEPPAEWMLRPPESRRENPIAPAVVDLGDAEATRHGERRLRGILRAVEEATAGTRHGALYWAARLTRELHDAGHVTEALARDRLDRAAAVAWQADLSDARLARETEREIAAAIRDGWLKGGAR